MLCPICKKPVPESAIISERPPFFPFCGERCKLIDLGRWLGEKYRVPMVNREEADEPTLPPDAEP
jgi:endogenous inhibitor of DNA gyrase (YacG/DUF329 family)